MTEETLVALLTQLLKPTLRDLPATRTAAQLDAQAAIVADAAWAGLVMLLRQSLATGEPAALADVGHFERTDAEIRFVPAAALLEAASLQKTPADAHVFMIERAVLYLREGMALLQSVPFEARAQAIPAAEILTPEEKLLRAIFGRSGAADAPLVDRLDPIARGLAVMVRRLGGPTQTARPATTTASRDFPLVEIEPPPQETTGEAGPSALTTDA